MLAIALRESSWQTFALGRTRTFRHRGIGPCCDSSQASRAHARCCHRPRLWRNRRRLPIRRRLPHRPRNPTTTANPTPGCAGPAAKIPAPSISRRRSSQRTASSRRSRSRPHAIAPIDCFYVYPTVSLDQTGNSDMTAGPEEHGVILQQFARFSSVCRAVRAAVSTGHADGAALDHCRQGDPDRSHARVQRCARGLELLSQERQRRPRRRARRPLAGLGRAARS